MWFSRLLRNKKNDREFFLKFFSYVVYPIITKQKNDREFFKIFLICSLSDYYETKK
jgi:hypothetical protein